MLNEREQIKEILQNECDIRNLDIEIDNYLLDLILIIIEDAELYDMILKLDLDY